MKPILNRFILLITVESVLVSVYWEERARERKREIERERERERERKGGEGGERQLIEKLLKM